MDQEHIQNSPTLQSRRECMGLSQMQLARLSALSVRQVQQIEQGGLDAFYSEKIKQLAMRKMQQILDTLPQEPHRLRELLAHRPEQSERTVRAVGQRSSLPPLSTRLSGHQGSGGV